MVRDELDSASAMNSWLHTGVGELSWDCTIFFDIRLDMIVFLSFFLFAGIEGALNRVPIRGGWFSRGRGA